MAFIKFHGIVCLEENNMVCLLAQVPVLIVTEGHVHSIHLF